MSEEIVGTGFGSGFSREVEAILRVADRGILYPREVRENLARAGMIIYEEVEMPSVEPPVINDYEEFDEEEFIELPDDNEETD